MREVFVVALRLAVGGLELGAEMTAAALVALEGVAAHQQSEFEEVVDPAGFLQALVECVAVTEHTQIAPELLVERRYLRERLLEPFGRALHPAVVPHDAAELTVEEVDRARPFDREEPVEAVARLLLGAFELRMIGGHRLRAQLRREVVADRGGEHEVAVGQALHERRRAEPVGAVVGEVRLAGAVQTGNRGHELVVDPEAAHRVMRCRVDAHRHVVRVLVGDALVHLDQVPVPLADRVLTEAGDRVGEVEIDAVLQRTDALAAVDFELGRPRGDVARRQVSEARIATLEEIVALVVWNLVLGTLVVGVLRYPDAGVVAQRLRHERELRLELVALGDACGMDLRVTGIREERAPAVGPPDGRGVARFGVRRQEERVGVATGGEHDRVGRVRGDVAGDQVTDHDAGAAPVDDDDVEHLGALVERHRAEPDLAGERLVRTEEQLLSGLAPRVERAAHLRPTERPVVEQPAVLAGERHSLGHALIDDRPRELRQPVDVGLTRSEVAALHGVVEEAED